MAKNAKESAQVKSRTTKLSKKSSSELIEIILRKDKTERNLNSQISTLKSEVNALNEEVANFDKKMEGTYQSLDTYKQKYKEAEASIRECSKNAKNSIELLDAQEEKTAYYAHKAKCWKITAICAFSLLVMSIIFIVL